MTGCIAGKKIKGRGKKNNQGYGTLYTPEKEKKRKKRKKKKQKKKRKRKKEKKRGRRNRRSDAELQFRCGQVGRGIQIHATPPSTYTQPYYLKRAFPHFSTLSSQTNGPMYLQTDGPTSRPVLILSHQSSTKTKKKVRKNSENS